MGDHQQPDVIQQNPLEAPPEFSMESPDFSVLRPETDDLCHRQSPCANSCFSSSANRIGSGNSLKRSSPSSINSQQPKPKKLFLDEPANYPFPRRCVSDPNRPPPPQSLPDSARGISSNASPTPKMTHHVTDSATPCFVKDSASAADRAPLASSLADAPMLRLRHLAMAGEVDLEDVEL